jgi:Putative translation factor (SUA5)
VKEEFGNKIKFILDGGRSKIGLESTIISLVDEPKILRLGGMERKKINKVLNKNIKYDRVNKKISIPGQSKLHYSPGIPIKLNIKKAKPNEAFILIKKRKKSSINYYYLSKNKNLKRAAKNLYKTLRKIKNKNYKSIVVEKIPNTGFGEVINDRLKRASAK